MKNHNQFWVATVKCTIIKEVTCQGCSEDEAMKNPFGYSVDERELSMPDWEVVSVEPNE